MRCFIPIFAVLVLVGSTCQSQNFTAELGAAGASTRMYSVPVLDGHSKLVFSFGDNTDHEPPELFVDFARLKASLRSWNLQTSGESTATPSLTAEQMLTLLYWKTCGEQADLTVLGQAVPNDKIDPDDLNRLVMSTNLLPIEEINNLLKTDRDWYVVALQQILARAVPKEDFTQERQDIPFDPLCKRQAIYAGFSKISPGVWSKMQEPLPLTKARSGS